MFQDEYNVDIRMFKSNKEAAIGFLEALKGKWIYIKYLNRISENQNGLYTKLRVYDVDLFCDDEWMLYGYEDDDRIVIAGTEIKQFEMTFELDEIRLRGDGTDMYIRLFNPRPQSIKDIQSVQKNLIITEGKTDWKILKAALEYFRSKGKFLNLNMDFLEYEDDLGAGNSTMERVADYNAIFPNDNLRVFIFDNDDSKINRQFGEKEKYICKGNNVFCMLLPIPAFRKDTPLISIENLFIDEDIKRTDSYGRRLYMAGEFGKDNRHIENHEIIACKVPKEPNHIIDKK